MDRAHVRHQENLAKLVEYNPELSVMADQEWIDSCRNEYIVKMAKKMYLYPLMAHEIRQIDKAVTGYLAMLESKRDHQPVPRGNGIVTGVVTHVKMTCDHENCSKHLKMSILEDNRYTIYAPVVPDILGADDPSSLIGDRVSFYASLTRSDRDPTFGFAHKPKLMRRKKCQSDG